MVSCKELGHTLQCDCEDDSEAAQVHARSLEHLTLLDSWSTSRMVPSAVSRVSATTWREKSHAQHPQVSGKPLPSLFVLARRPSVSDSQMYLAMIPTMYLAPGTFPARSPITARGSLPVLGEGRRRNGVRGGCVWVGISPQQGGGPSITGISMGIPVACPPPAALLILWISNSDSASLSSGLEES